MNTVYKCRHTLHQSGKQTYVVSGWLNRALHRNREKIGEKQNTRNIRVIVIFLSKFRYDMTGSMSYCYYYYYYYYLSVKWLTPWFEQLLQTGSPVLDRSTHFCFKHNCHTTISAYLVAVFTVFFWYSIYTILSIFSHTAYSQSIYLYSRNI